MSELNHLLPDLVKVNTVGDETELTLYISAEIDYFKGHFPQAPVLPGVAQLDWAVHFASQYLTLSSHVVQNVEVLKFQVVIQPELEVKLILTQKSGNKFTFKYVSEKGTHASGRIVTLAE